MNARTSIVETGAQSGWPSSGGLFSERPSFLVSGYAPIALLALTIALSPLSAWAAPYGGKTFGGLVGIGATLFQGLCLCALYVVSFGLFIYMGCILTGIKGSMSNAFGAAAYIAVYTALLLAAYFVSRPFVDPTLAQVVLFGGLVLSGPHSIKNVYNNTFIRSVGAFVIAAVLTALVIGIALAVLQATKQ